MTAPAITAVYLAILALFYAALSARVVSLRRRLRISLGDGGNEALRCAIRAHGHFAEYVPITVLMIAILEMSGASSVLIHMLMGLLLLSRLLHPIGIHAKPGSRKFNIGRVGGMTLTLAVMVASAVGLLSRFVFGIV